MELKLVEARRQIDGRQIRFTDFFDAESAEFEKALGFELPLVQSLTYLKNTRREYRLFQATDRNGRPSLQAVVSIGHSPLFRGFSMGSVTKMPVSRERDGAEEELGIRALRELCAAVPGLMTLRLQPERLVHGELMDFQSRASRQGFQLVDPVNITRTLFWELGESEDERYQRLHGKTRAKLRHRGRDLVDLRVIVDPGYIPICRAATNVSRSKTGGATTSYDFEAAFSLAAKHPDQARIVGLFLRHRPEELLCYVIGLKRGELLEYSSAGAFHDAELRTIPFNYFLLWELAKWGTEQGCRVMDMGGVTDGAESDPLSGISRFKRTLTERELETGREMLTVLRPMRYWFYQRLTDLRDRVRG
jgi:hypothetical protein